MWTTPWGVLHHVTQPCVTATGLVNGKWQNSTPTESTPLNRSPKKLSHVMTSATPAAVPLSQIWCKSVQTAAISNIEKLLQWTAEWNTSQIGNKTANINIKNYSLSTLLTAMDQKPQKSHRHLGDMVVGNITVLMINVIWRLVVIILTCIINILRLLLLTCTYTHPLWCRPNGYYPSEPELFS